MFMFANAAHCLRTAAMALSALLAAGCCGSSPERCTATLDYHGKTGPGAGANKAEAQVGACWKHCGDHDPDIEAAWQRWKATGGKSSGDKFSDLAGVPSLKLRQKACEGQCLADINVGKATITFDSSCK